MTTRTVLTFSYLGTSALADQAGQRGRPRKCGRATVDVSHVSPTPSVADVRKGLASHYGVELSKVTLYPRETSEGSMTFACSAIGVSDRISMILGAETSEAPAESAPEATEAAPSAE